MPRPSATPSTTDAALAEARDRTPEALDAARVFDTAVGSVVHDLRAPVAGVIAAAQLLAGETPGSTLSHRLVEIVDRSERMIDDLVTDLVRRAKLHVPDAPPPRVEIALAPFLRRLADVIEVARDVRVDVEVGTTMIWTVETALTRIALNLLDNAARHSGQRSISVEIRATTSGIEVAFADRGCGLPASIARWFADDEPSAPRAADLGLGLTTSVGLVTELGGRIFHDQTWTGTRLVVSLPQRGDDAGRRRDP